MLIRPLGCVVDYVIGLNASLNRIAATPLTKSQRGWLVTVLMGLSVFRRGFGKNPDDIMFCLCLSA